MEMWGIVSVTRAACEARPTQKYPLLTEIAIFPFGFNVDAHTFVHLFFSYFCIYRTFCLYSNGSEKKLGYKAHEITSSAWLARMVTYFTVVSFENYI